MTEFEPTVFGLDHKEDTPSPFQERTQEKLACLKLPYVFGSMNRENWQPELLNRLGAAVGMEPNVLAEKLGIAPERLQRLKDAYLIRRSTYVPTPTYKLLQRIAEFAWQEIGTDATLDQALRDHLVAFFSDLLSATKAKNRPIPWNYNQLCLLRAVLRLTREEMAQKLNLKFNTYKSLEEKNGRQRPNFKTLECLCTQALQALASK